MNTVLTTVQTLAITSVLGIVFSGIVLSYLAKYI